MNKNELIQIIQNLKSENTTVKLDLANKKKKYYSFFSAICTKNVQEEIKSMITNNLNQIFLLNELVEFNPVGKEDQTIEHLSAESVSGYDLLSKNKKCTENFVDKFEDLSDVNFYVITLTNGNDTIEIFRKYSKSKSLSKGLLYKISDTMFDKIKENIFQIDCSSDFVSINYNDIIVLNRYPFELITDYKDNYIENLNKAMCEIESSNLIDNLEEFKEDCKNSMRIAKQFTKAMQCSSISLILEHINQVNDAIREAELPIEFINNKFKYENKEQLSILVALLSDKYAKTLIGERITT